LGFLCPLGLSPQRSLSHRLYKQCLIHPPDRFPCYTSFPLMFSGCPLDSTGLHFFQVPFFLEIVHFNFLSTNLLFSPPLWFVSPMCPPTPPVSPSPPDLVTLFFGFAYGFVFNSPNNSPLLPARSFSVTRMCLCEFF